MNKRIKEAINNIKSFNDIYEWIDNKEFNNKEKGDLFEVITKYVFLIHPE